MARPVSRPLVLDKVRGDIAGQTLSDRYATQIFGLAIGLFCRDADLECGYFLKAIAEPHSPVCVYGLAAFAPCSYFPPQPHDAGVTAAHLIGHWL
jgi:hypothetical protein